MKILLDKESRKGREYLARRAEILKAGEKLFAERGYHGTTILDLANLSQFSVGTLYNFFKTKEEVYYTLVMEKLDFFQLRLNTEVNQHPAGLAQILALIEATVKFFKENQSFFRIFIQERSAFELQVGAAAIKELRDKHLAFIDFVAHVMTNAIKKGDIQEFNALEVAYSLVGILNSLLVYWTMDTKANELGSKVPFIYDLFLKGVVKRKQKK
jgi:AcrR family transcriptional regulator